jgi:hypothetical protein
MTRIRADKKVGVQHPARIIQTDAGCVEQAQVPARRDRSQENRFVLWQGVTSTLCGLGRYTMNLRELDAPCSA